MSFPDKTNMASMLTSCVGKEIAMIEKTDTKKNVLLYFVFAYGFSWLFWISQALEAQGVSIPLGFSRFLASPLCPAAFGPLVAALVLTLINDGWKGIVALLKRGISLRFNKVWLFPALLLPLVIFAGSIFMEIWTGTTELDLSVISNPSFAIVGFFVIVVTAGPLQEEFGWRGYALPRIQARHNALISSLILGVLWWLWHLPLVFIPGKFMVGTLVLFAALLPVIVLSSILCTWIFNNTKGSILAAILFHSSMNWSIWAMLPSMKVNASIIGFKILFLSLAVALVLAIWGPRRLTKLVDSVYF